MNNGYLVLIRDIETRSIGVVCNDNGCPIFDLDNANYEARPDPMHPNIEYKILCLNDLFND